MTKKLPNITPWTIGSESITFDVDHSTGDSIELEFTIDQSNPQEACRFLLFKFGDNKTYLSSGSSINRTFTFNSDGVTEVKVIGQPSFAGVTEFRVPLGTKNRAKLFLSGALAAFQDLEGIVLRNARLYDQLTSNDVSGVKTINFSSTSEGDTDGAAGVLDISDLDSSIETISTRFSGYTIVGDWGLVPDDAWPNFTLLDIQNNSAYLEGGLADLLKTAPDIQYLGERPTRVFGSNQQPLTDFQFSSGALTTVSFLRGRVFAGTFADFPDFECTWRLDEVRDIYGELGNLPPKIRALNGFPTDFGDQNEGTKVTYNAYDPKKYEDFHTIGLDDPNSTDAQLNVMPARAAREAAYLNAQPTGFFLRMRHAEAISSSIAGWQPKQHPWRAMQVYPNVSTELTGVDTSLWKASWAVAEVTAIPSTSSITIDQSVLGDSTAIPTDSTLVGEVMHLFASDSDYITGTTTRNDTGPYDEADSAKEYIVSAVTDNGDGTLTIDLDVVNGASISDTGSGSINSNTRIVVTW